MPLLLEDYLVSADLLFVGMNPSFSRQAVEKILRVAVPDSPDVDAFFTWDAALDGKSLERRIAEVACFETTARVVYNPYFRPLERFAKRVGAKTQAHIDMFLMRHTSQKALQKTHGATFNKLSPFAREQFELFRYTLEAMDPKVVVVVNAGASDIALEGLGLTSADNGRSYYWDKLPAARFFLSGMLSGQRALDTYSRVRLELDVKAALQEARS
ncbi:hypothetical protein [Variovorax guangxiensis]|uniref:Uncharacterized protein n=1 Tax=Variovorax guangxiensis TaxID=1775474 RepID=A0A502DJP6_9BURK|nr:hypothetical protein [Variovorax guangxiensis]TPG21383.1 hypothetical protein EAH83_17555 [Variovorax ginsengisoli]TPG25433.1 hypothetical protein EAH82_18040 [Variovorax guangxiensis]